LLEANSPEVLALAERVMQKCVLERVQEPTHPFNQAWVQPGGPYYLGQWMWDTQFVVDLLSIYPEQKQTIRDVFQNYWDYQDRWNNNFWDWSQRWGGNEADLPPWPDARDMITGVIKSGNQAQRDWSQIPIIAWGLERVYRRNGDKELLNQALPRVEKFYDWYWRERDLHGNGLICVGTYTPESVTKRVQHSRWETFDLEINMDGLKLTVHPSRKGPREKAWYGDLCVPGNNAYLIAGERSLARLAEAVGDKEMAARRRQRIRKGVEGMREHMWDEEAGTFLTVKRDPPHEKVRARTIGSWIPLYAQVPTEAMAARMAEVLASPAFRTPLPVPTADPAHRKYNPKGFWRGDVWPPTNYQIASGLAAYGHTDLAADIADKSVENAISKGICEKRGYPLPSRSGYFLGSSNGRSGSSRHFEGMSFAPHFQDSLGFPRTPLDVTGVMP